MEVIPAQIAKNQFGDLLMKVQREPVEISKHVKRVAVAISPEEYDQFVILKLQSLKATLAESIREPHNLLPRSSDGYWGVGGITPGTRST